MRMSSNAIAWLHVCVAYQFQVSTCNVSDFFRFDPPGNSGTDGLDKKIDTSVWTIWLLMLYPASVSPKQDHLTCRKHWDSIWRVLEHQKLPIRHVNCWQMSYVKLVNGSDQIEIFLIASLRRKYFNGVKTIIREDILKIKFLRNSSYHGENH